MNEVGRINDYERLYSVVDGELREYPDLGPGEPDYWLLLPEELVARGYYKTPREAIQAEREHLTQQITSHRIMMNKLLKELDKLEKRTK